MRISVLGLGNMGHALAALLLEKGHDVTVWNRTAGKAEDLVQAGAVQAGSLNGAVERAEVVMMCLTNDAAVRAVALVSNLVGTLPARTVLVDMSTVSPDTSRAVGAAVSGGRFIDAPVLGGPTPFGREKPRCCWAEIVQLSMDWSPSGTILRPGTTTTPERTAVQPRSSSCRISS